MGIDSLKDFHKFAREELCATCSWPYNRVSLFVKALNKANAISRVFDHVFNFDLHDLEFFHC